MPAEPLEPALSWGEYIIVRLLRRWAASREAAEDQLPHLVELSTELGQRPELAVSLHSLFQLAEGRLGRPLEAECCCSRDLSSDERAIITLIGLDTPTQLPSASEAMPHGIPGALLWAATTVKLILSMPVRPVSQHEKQGCPFKQTTVRMFVR